MSNDTAPFVERSQVFLPGDGFGVRLPGLIVSQKGTVIATCQKRKGDIEDVGHETDILVRRSTNDGKSWDTQKVIFAEHGVNTYLGPIFEDRQTNAIFIAFWKLATEDKEEMEALRRQGEAGGGFWLSKSSDQGQSWSQPQQVVAKPNSSGWVGVTGNSVHGVQLTRGPNRGRLVIPGWLYRDTETVEGPFHPGTKIPVASIRGGLLYSDDGGTSWRVGGVLLTGSSELAVAESTGGCVYVNYRRSTDPYYNGLRWYARSDDGGESFHEEGQVQEQITPGCHAGITCYPTDDQEANILLFSNPAWYYYRQPPSWNRVRLTVRASYDDGRNWTVAKLLEEGHAGYSDLAVSADRTILCVYEGQLDWSQKKLDDWYNSFTFVRKRRPWCEAINIARINLDWLTGI